MKRWAYNVLLAFDKLGNAVSGGEHNETISARLGRVKRSNGGTVPKGAWFGIAHPLDVFLEWLDPGHAIESLQNHEDDACRICGASRE